MVVTLALVTSSSRHVCADDFGDASKNFINKIGQETIALANDKSIKYDTYIARFKFTLTENIDIPEIGKFVLGRYWRQATEDQKTSFNQLMVDFITKTYALRFTEYSGEMLRVTDARKDGNGNFLVASELVLPSTKQPVNITWRVRQAGNSHKITDVIIEGISMAITQRDEFTSVIQANGIDGMISKLRQSLERP